MMREIILRGYGDFNDSESKDVSLALSGGYIPVLSVSRKSKLIIVNRSTTTGDAARFTPNDNDSTGMYLEAEATFVLDGFEGTLYMKADSGAAAAVSITAAVWPIRIQD
jgi:hypothetical protein